MKCFFFSLQPIHIERNIYKPSVHINKYQLLQVVQNHKCGKKIQVWVSKNGFNTEMTRTGERGVFVRAMDSLRVYVKLHGSVRK